MVKQAFSDRQQAPSHYIFAHAKQSGKTKIQVQLDMKQDFKNMMPT
jgi:hypothetical protein